MQHDRGVQRRGSLGRMVLALLVGSGLPGGAMAPGMAQAATQTVTNCTTDGTPAQAGTLRYVITTAAPGDTITFACSGTITLSNAHGGPLSIGKSLKLDGSGQTVTVSGGNRVEVFFVHNGATFDIVHLTIANGSANEGAGIWNNYSTVTITGSTVSGSSAGFVGGGIENTGTMTVTNSTVAGNSASQAGGGIWNNGGSLTVTNSTISGNSAPLGGGIFNSGVQNTAAVTSANRLVSGSRSSRRGPDVVSQVGTVSLTYSTISNNSAFVGGGIANSNTVILAGTIVARQVTGGDCARFGGSSISRGYNLDSDGSCSLTRPTDKPRTDPKLGPLQNNGGPTQTQQPGAGSPAIDGGGSSCPATDQRGVPRPQGPACDIGAVEVVQPRAPNTGPVAVGQPVTITISNVNAGHPPALLYALDCSGSGTYTLTPTHGTSPSGTCTFTTTGPHVVRVAVELASDGTIVGTTQTTVQVTKVATTTTVTSSINPSASGQPVSFTATVTPASGSGTPSGTVQFSMDGTPFGSPVPLSGGRATSQTTSSLAPGSHTVSATYSGDATYLGSSGSLTQTVSQPNQGIVVPSQSSKGVTVEAHGTSDCTTVTSSTKVSASGSPSGTFAFRDERPGGKPCGAYRVGVVTLQAVGIDAVVCTSHSTASIYGRATHGAYPSMSGSTVTFRADVAITSESEPFNGTVSVQTSSGYTSGAVPAAIRIAGC